MRSKEVEKIINEIEMKLKATFIIGNTLFEENTVISKEKLETLLSYISELEVIVDDVKQDEIIYRSDLEEQYIHKDMIKNKIEYLKEYGTCRIRNPEVSFMLGKDTEYVKQEQIDVLEELLEGE